MPSAGPSASMGNAYFHPTLATTGGTSWIDIVVRRNPIDVCSVNAGTFHGFLDRDRAEFRCGKAL